MEATGKPTPSLWGQALKAAIGLLVVAIVAVGLAYASRDEKSQRPAKTHGAAVSAVADSSTAGKSQRSENPRESVTHAVMNSRARVSFMLKGVEAYTRREGSVDSAPFR
jgi:hypothetical protein